MFASFNCECLAVSLDVVLGATELIRVSRDEP